MKSNNTTKKTGFTLLELLIVMAIIGLLASAVMVSFPGAQKRARIAQGQGFADTIRGSLQADVVGWWPFDETSGSTAKDNWLGENHGTVYGATWTEGITNGALDFDGSNDWVQFGGDIGINGAMTIEFWFNTPNKNTNDYFFDNRSPGTWWFIKNYTGGTCGANPGNICFEGRVMALNEDWNVNEWTHIAVSDDTTTAKMYINGKLVDTGTGQNTVISTNLRAGTRYTNSGYFPGKIDEVRVYNVALPLAVIRQHYVSGLESHQNFAKK